MLDNNVTENVETVAPPQSLYQLGLRMTEATQQFWDQEKKFHGKMGVPQELTQGPPLWLVQNIVGQRGALSQLSIAETISHDLIFSILAVLPEELNAAILEVFNAKIGATYSEREQAYAEQAEKAAQPKLIVPGGESVGKLIKPAG